MDSQPPRQHDFDSPTRQTYSETQRSGHSPYRNGSPYPIGAIDSPSRQLLQDLARLVIESEREFQSRLDEAATERERAHQAALEAAVYEHTKVRHGAERVQELVKLEYLKEQKKREDEEKRELDRVRRETEAEEHRRKLEELRREEEERERVAQQAEELAEAEARLREQQEKLQAEQAKLKAEREEAERRTKEIAKPSAAPAVQPPASPTVSKPPVSTLQPAPAALIPKTAAVQESAAAGPLISTTTAKEAVHAKYISLHQELKKLRAVVKQHGDQNKPFKAFVGDNRREIKKRVGQLTGDKKANLVTCRAIIEVLTKAISIQDAPTVDARQYLVTPPAHASVGSHVSIAFIYLINIFCKAVIAQFINEVNSDAGTVDAIGIVISQVFSTSELQLGDTPLVDILWAKYHVSCPVLFGIYGSDRTESGRKRLGWIRTGDGWLDAKQHADRMLGLGAGYASISLRDYSKSKKKNPVPNTEYWRALSCVVNTPPQDVTESHLQVLKGLVMNYAERFIKIYGKLAVVALRRAIFVLPDQIPEPLHKSAAALKFLADKWKKDIHLHI